MTKQDKMKINNLLVRIKQIEDEIERLRLFDNQIEANYNRAFDWGVTNRIMLDEQCRKIGDLKAEIKHLNTIVERLDELLGKGINDYIMGIDGVEGLKDMWERSAVREFAEKLKTQLEAKEQHYICMYDWNGHSAVTDCENEVDELLKEYE